MKTVTLYLLFFFGFLTATAQHNIIPEPANYGETKGSFIINAPVSIEVKNKQLASQKNISDFTAFLNRIGIKTGTKDTKKIIVKPGDNQLKKLGNEAYRLNISNNEITITANSNAGVFYAFQSLRQMLPVEAQQSPIEIQTCSIEDYPRFKWRGLMLDVSRHFFTVEEVKQYIDLMSQYKFNVFHWHLTDDNGWRIEIKSLPKLTEVGAWRVARYGKFGSERAEPKKGEPTPYGGFYTQDQIREIVQYAADRHIRIVPEIDMPGHSMALLAAYPELSVNKEPKYVSPGNKFAEWYSDGKFKMLVENTLNPIDEKVYEAIDKIFTEVAELFPGEYIHMGGDEAYHGYWDENEAIQKFMKKHKIKNTHELQSYFVKRVEKIIHSKGKKMIGWDEILEGGLAKDAAVMSWRGMKGGIEAAKMGHEVVMSPTTFAYLDYMQGDVSVENKIYASLSLKKAYAFEPVPEGIDPKFILGGQANLWTEAIPTLPFAFYMTYPRAFATAESVWSPKSKKNWENFIRKTEVHFERFDKQNLNICKAEYDPIVKVYEKDGKLMCELTNHIPGSEIYYTVNNTYPVKFGIRYTGAFEVPEGDVDLRTQTMRNGKLIGRELRIHRSDLSKRIKR